MNRLRELMRRDGWLLAALGVAVLLCLGLGLAEGQPASHTEEEARLSRVLSAMEGAGEVEVAVFYADDSVLPCGAVVVAQGAGDVDVRLRLSRAVCTLLGLDNNQVDIFKLGGKQP